MFDLLKRLYIKTEELKGKRLLVVLLFTFTSFTIIGIAAGYFINTRLNKDEKSASQTQVTPPAEEKKFYEGKVLYVNPELYPLDRVSYSLNDSSGKVLFLLRVNDQKLALAENLNVKIYGKVSKSQDGKMDVIDVSEVVIKNASN
jgi:hypothetical protein